MNIKEKSTQSFPAKILLFGEYGVMHNARGLYMPLKKYTGVLSFNTKRLTQKAAKASNLQLKQHASYIDNLVQQGKLKFDIASFQRDIKQGLVFDTDIPQGFGLGSSGALCAALYHRYALERIPRSIDFTSKQVAYHLKEVFAHLEAYFHGKSSGFDPLSCYLNQPFLVKPSCMIEPVSLSHDTTKKDYVVFLLNTKETSKTQLYVRLFLEKCKNPTFLDSIKNEFIPTNDHCITSFLKGDIETFLASLKELSSYLLARLSQMVPQRFIEIWEQGLESQCYYLKLCGAGGGGFLLGFTGQFEKTKELLKGHSITVVHRF